MILDGGGAWRFLGEVLADTDQPSAGRTTAPSFSEFVRWDAAQNSRESYEHWVKRLDGLDGPSLLLPGDGLPSAIRHGLDTVRRPLYLTNRVAAAARALQVTSGTIHLAAWLLLVSRMRGHADVVCGTTTSYRSEEDTSVQTVGMHTAA